MTVSSSVRKAGPFAGNNQAITFPFSFKVFVKGDVKVLLVSPSGVSTPLTLDSDYSVLLNANQNSQPGGWITYPSAPNVAPLGTGYDLVILGNLPYDQETDITNSGGFYPNVIEDMSDRSTIQIQQLAEITSRAIVLNEGESASPTLPSALARANTVVGFDALGNLEMYPVTPAVGAGDLKNEIWNAGQDFTAGTSTFVTTSRLYGTKANLGSLVVDGVAQDPDSYSLVGDQVQFTSAIPAYTKKIWCTGGTTLSQGLPPNGSVGDVQLAWLGILSRAVDSIASLRLLGSSTHDRAFVAGYHGIGTAGGGAFYADTSDTTSADNGVTIFVANDGTRWKRPSTGRVTFCQAGAYGTGSANDDTVAIQACIDAMKGQTVIADSGKTFYAAGLLLSGSSYNGTTIRGDGWLLMKPDAGASNFGGGWVGIIIQQCDGVTVDLKINGNRANMTAREQIFCVGLAGASNVKIPYLEVHEIRGDGLYIGQSNWQASSSQTNSVWVGTLKGINTADDGRNLLSIISGSDIDIDFVYSRGIGGTINGTVEPGGIDIEPDQGYEFCNNIHIGYADIVTAGTSGLGIYGKSMSGNDANLDWNCQDIRIDNFKVLKTGTAGAALSGSPFVRCADVKVKGVMAYNTTAGQGPQIDFCQRIDFDLDLQNTTVGVWLGAGGNVYDYNLRVKSTVFSVAGVRTTGVSRGRVHGSARGALAGAYGVQCYNNGRAITQTDAAYEVDSPYDGAMARAFRNEVGNTVAFGTGCIVRNCDWSGYASYDVTCDALIPLQDVIGMTSATSIPTIGTWHWQTFVRNSQPAAVAGKTTIGWARLNSGSNNVLSSDWVPCVVTNS